MNSKTWHLLLENSALWILLPAVAIQALFLTLQLPPWLKNVRRDQMHGLIDLEYPYGCHLSNEIQKIRTSFSENHAPAFAAPIYHPSSFIDLSIIVLDNRRSVRTICTVSGSNSAHVDVNGPMTFEKKKK